MIIIIIIIKKITTNYSSSYYYGKNKGQHDVQDEVIVFFLFTWKLLCLKYDKISLKKNNPGFHGHNTFDRSTEKIKKKKQKKKQQNNK